MTRQDFLNQACYIAMDCHAVLTQKSNEYSKEDDAFSAFRNASRAGVTVDQAILTRILEKVERLLNNPKDPQIEDLINHFIILKVWREYGDKASADN